MEVNLNVIFDLLLILRLKFLKLDFNFYIRFVYNFLGFNEFEFILIWFKDYKKKIFKYFKFKIILNYEFNFY